jgi:hypothetical protein
MTDRYDVNATNGPARLRMERDVADLIHDHELDPAQSLEPGLEPAGTLGGPEAQHPPVRGGEGPPGRLGPGPSAIDRSLAAETRSLLVRRMEKAPGPARGLLV